MAFLEKKSRFFRKFERFRKRTDRIFNYLKPYWKLWIALFIVAVFSTAIGLVNPLIVKFLIDKVFLARNYALFRILMFVFIGATLLSTGIGIVVAYFYRKLEYSIIYDVRAQLFDHIQRLHLQFFRKWKIGDLLVRLGTDIAGIEGFMSAIFHTLILNILSLIFILIVCFILAWKLTLVSLCAVPFFIFSQRFYAQKLKKMYRVVMRRSAALMDFFQEKLSAISLVKVFVREEKELEQQKEKTRKLIDIGLKVTLTSEVAGAIIGLITASVLFYVFWYGGSQIIKGVLTLGSFVAIYSYLSGLFGPIGALVGLYTDIQPTLVSVDRVFRILDIKSKIREKKGAKALPKIKGSIQFKNVTFSYNKKPVLKELNFTIKPGEKIGIVGGTGVGKSTITNLILRLYDPREGKILIDGHDIKDITLKSLRDQIGLAQQDVLLFNTSVRENISYGKPRALFKEIKKSAIYALADDFIRKLPQKYRTSVGVKGMTLSGGERQRVSLARVFLKNPQIFALDEATSFLDSTTEQVIHDNLFKLAKEKTVLIIAHRLSTLEDVDRILVLSKGRIVEKGTFSELLKKKGIFFRYYTHQVGGIQRFKEKLLYELERAKELKKPLYISWLRLINIDQLIGERGERQVSKLFEQIDSSIFETLAILNFFVQNPEQKEMFFIVMPETDKEKATLIISQLIKDLLKKFPQIKLESKIFETKETIPEPLKQLLK